MCLLYVQALYCYTTVLQRVPTSCYCPIVACQMYNDILFVILFSIIPPILMILFGWMTIDNVRRSRLQVYPSVSQSNHQHVAKKKKDQQMIVMMLMQIVFFCIGVVPSGISKSYTVLTSNQEKNLLRLTEENFSFQVE